MKFKNKWVKEIIGDDVCNDNPLEYVESTDWAGDCLSVVSLSNRKVERFIKYE